MLINQDYTRDELGLTQPIGSITQQRNRDHNLETFLRKQSSQATQNHDSTTANVYQPEPDLILTLFRWVVVPGSIVALVPITAFILTIVGVMLATYIFYGPTYENIPFSVVQSVPAALTTSEVVPEAPMHMAPSPKPEDPEVSEQPLLPAPKLPAPDLPFDSPIPGSLQNNDIVPQKDDQENTIIEPFSVPSNNTYKLIPLENPGDGRVPAEHGDLNLALREPTRSDADTALTHYDAGDFDPNAPKLHPVFNAADIVNTYTVHDWDWGCNCKGALMSEGHLIGLALPEGTPIYIPRKEQDVYQKKYYAVVLYASENSLTFVYAREGTVANAYVVHYHNFQVDPNLLKTYQMGHSNERPALALDTPIGTANGELIISIRDRGRFMDTRSKRDWWQ
ncbi:MAG: hypothetical protein AAF629_17205 [Chloroflexota bacterium]